MAFLDGKGWIAREFFNEYLELKQEITMLTQLLERYEDVKSEALLIEKIQQFRFVVKELENKGIKAVDLMLLSMNVDLEEYQ